MKLSIISNITNKVRKMLGLMPQTKPLDESEIKISVGLRDNKIVVNLGKSISFLSMNKQQCISLIEALSKTATLIK